MATYSPFPGPFERGVVACTRLGVLPLCGGRDQGAGGQVGTGPRHAAVIGRQQQRCGRHPHAFLGLLRVVRAQPQIADIGFRGDIAHIGEHIEEAVDIGLGGSLGPDAAFIDWLAGAVPVDQVPDALLRIATRYRDEHRPGEPFHLWARRSNPDELRSMLAGTAGAVTP